MLVTKSSEKNKQQSVIYMHPEQYDNCSSCSGCICAHCTESG